MQRRSTADALAVERRQLLEAPSAAPGASSWRRRFAPIALIASDVLLALLCWQTASVLQGLWGQGELSEATATATVPVLAVWVGVRGLLGLYPGYGLDPVEVLRRHTYSVFVALAVIAVLALGFQVGQLSRLLLMLLFFGLLVLAPFTRYLTTRAMRRFGFWGKPVVVLSYKETGTNMVRVLKDNWDLGYDPVALFDFRLDTAGVLFSDINHQHALTGIVELARARGADTAIFAMPYTRREQLAKLVSQASISFRHVMIIPNLTGVTNSAVVARNLGGTFAAEIKHNLLDPWALRTKRVLDFGATVVGGMLVLPLLAALAALVYLESGGPVFYRDDRMGRDGSLFSCVKFRTMVPNSEELLWRILEEDAEKRAEYAEYHKLRDDPRVTRAGRFLRKTSLDELPQLWNVLKGEMSLVGPRPYLLRESKEIGVTQSEILRVPPGMTGPWQVAGRNDSSFEERTRMDAYYVRDWSVWLDIILLARTAKIVLRRRGAY